MCFLVKIFKLSLAKDIKVNTRSHSVKKCDQSESILARLDVYIFDSFSIIADSVIENNSCQSN